MLTCPACEAQVEGSPKFCPACGSNLAVVARAGDDPYIGKLVAGKYLVEKVLGEGGMGKVYLAVQQPLDKKVVLKVLRQALHGDASLVARFQREARAASRLTHPNSIQVTDFGQMEDGALYIAMEYLEGLDLGQLLQRDGPLPQGRLVHIMDQVLSALADAHAANIIHRDLKPENVMVVARRDDPDTVKVLDFGIAKIQDPSDSPDAVALTQQGLVCGTPEYMSPEQAKGEPLDARSDLYAIGVILFQLSTGRLPFQSDTSVGMVTKHLIEEPPPARTINPTVTTELEALILRCMAKDPEVRPRTAVELRDLLNALGQGAQYTAATSPGTAPAPIAGGTQPEPSAHAPVAPQPEGPAGSLSGLPGMAPSNPAVQTAGNTMVPGQKGSKVFIFVGIGAVLLAAVGGYFAVASRGKGGEKKPNTIIVKDETGGAATGGSAATGTGTAAAGGTEVAANTGNTAGTGEQTGTGTAGGTEAGGTGTEAGNTGGTETGTDTGTGTEVAVNDPPGDPKEPKNPRNPRNPKETGGQKTDPKMARKFSADAQRFWAKGDFERAINLWEKAAKANPNDAMVYRRLGNAYLAKGDSRRAKQALRRYLQLEPRAKDRAMVEEMIRSG
ncbi:MAG: protein kinase [Deltaproteobacteria bacterium]|nr:protein kinase [Deltaproteobacteria bacterium]